MFSFKGFWFGILATSSSLAKIIGPIGVSYVYETFGTYAIFGGISVILGIALFDAMLLYPQVKVKFLKIQNVRYTSDGIYSSFFMNVDHLNITIN